MVSSVPRPTNEKRREAAPAPMLSEAIATVPPPMTAHPRPSCPSEFGLRLRRRRVARRRRRRLTRRLELTAGDDRPVRLRLQDAHRILSSRFRLEGNIGPGSATAFGVHLDERIGALDRHCLGAAAAGADLPGILTRRGAVDRDRGPRSSPRLPGIARNLA